MAPIAGHRERHPNQPSVQSAEGAKAIRCLTDAANEAKGAACPARKSSRCGQLAVQPVTVLKAEQLFQTCLNALLGFGFGCCVGRRLKLKPAFGAGEHAGDHRCLPCWSAAIALLADGDEQ